MALASPRQVPMCMAIGRVANFYISLTTLFASSLLRRLRISRGGTA
jgi:hypothetical protein